MKSMRKIAVVLMVLAVAFTFVSCKEAGGSSSSSSTLTVTKCPGTYSGTFEFYSGSLNYQSQQWSGTGWDIQLSPDTGVTNGQSGRYKVLYLYSYVNGTKDGDYLSYSPTDTTYVNVTVSGGRVSFESSEFKLTKNTLTGETKTDTKVKIVCSSVILDN